MSDSENPTTMTNDAPPTNNDPRDSEPVELGDAEGVYERDETGELTAVTDTIEWDGREYRVKHKPITTGEAGEFREWGDDVDMTELCEVMARKYETPDRSVEGWMDTDPRQFMACMELLVAKATGEEPSSEFHAEVRDELAKREGGSAGN